MAREMTKKTRRFSLEESDAIEENERILESGSQQRKENRENKESGEAAASAATAPSAEFPATEKTTVSTAAVVAETPTTTTPAADQPTTTSFSNGVAMNMRKPRGKKTENGITIYVPMEYYERIALMKMRTGVPIKDLALQAVIEFLDRNK
jgi:hypothetical protein